MSFSNLGLSPKVLSAVEAAGFETPTPIQEKAIPSVVAGRGQRALEAAAGDVAAGEGVDPVDPVQPGQGGGVAVDVGQMGHGVADAGGDEAALGRPASSRERSGAGVR